ncbi:MAG TPA: DUF1343 domain-containing protein [Armatimonadota bacterium]|nr:DUF1343 domain-containing protein [Armatimonadota bacterium]
MLKKNLSNLPGREPEIRRRLIFACFLVVLGGMAGIRARSQAAAGAAHPARRMISSAAAASISNLAPASGEIPASLTPSLERHAQVETGLDVLEAEGFRRLRGKNVGIVCNQTSVDRHGRHIIDLMTAAGIHVVALFSPEHGIRGAVDESVESSVDAKSGLKVYSLYDVSRPRPWRYRPSPQMLKGVDTLVFDIQDVGARFYTYLATLGYVMESAAEQHIPLIVLDRPNPLGGLDVEGPLLEPRYFSFAGFHTMPIIYGMTIGELAGLFNVEKHLGTDLEVVKMRGWNRRLLYDQTGLPWVNPSPNIRSTREAELYPGVGLLEDLPISVGRGTDAPFERVGAPWIDGAKLANNLNARRMAGVSFGPTRFTPRSSIYRGRECHGVKILLRDRRHFHPVSMGIEIADALANLYPAVINERTLKRMTGMAGTGSVPTAIACHQSPAAIVNSWRSDENAWRVRRKPFLLYPG